MMDGFLPGFEPSDKAAMLESSTKLYYVTNATNFRSILASGLIRSRNGWPKYATDFQEFFHGMIPFFREGVPFNQMPQVIAHDPNDLPVILEFDARTWLARNISYISLGGKSGITSLPQVASDARILLLNGVVPLADMRVAYFKDKKSMKRFASDCVALSNTRAELIGLTDGFSDIADLSLAPLTLSTADEATKVDLRRADAVGGVLAALTRGEIFGSSHLIRDLFPEWPAPSDGDRSQVSPLSSELALSIQQWIRKEASHSEDIMGEFLRITLDFLGAIPMSSGFSQEKLLVHMQKWLEQAPVKHQDALRSRLRLIHGIVEKDEDSEVFFEKKGSPVLRGLALFLLDHEYREDRTLLKGCNIGPYDLLIAEILRGALNGWTRVPIEMRGERQAEFAVGYAMARVANSVQGSLELAPRSFEWDDPQVSLLSMLREVVNSLAEKRSPRELIRLVADRKAAGVEIRIIGKASKKGAPPVKIERTLKGKKKKTLVFTLNLPWE